jgi:hypothetical protein
MSTISAGNTTTTSIRITGDTTGNLVFATGGSNTVALTIDATQNITTTQRFAKASMPTGSVLQVVSNTTSTSVSISSITFTDSGLSATITPTSSTSKILVMVTQSMDVYASGRGDLGMGIQLLRGATVIWNPSVSGTTSPSTGAGYGGGYVNAGGANQIEVDLQIPITYLDSPANTSPITYKTQGGLYTTANAAVLTFQSAGAANNGKSSIILMEIAA